MMRYSWFHTRTGFTGTKDFAEGTTIPKATMLLNQWNEQTVKMWNGLNDHYIYWMN